MNMTINTIWFQSLSNGTRSGGVMMRSRALPWSDHLFYSPCLTQHLQSKTRTEKEEMANLPTHLTLNC